MTRKESMLSLLSIVVLISLGAALYAKHCGYISQQMLTLLASIFLLTNATIFYCRVQARASEWTLGEQVIFVAFTAAGIGKIIELLV